MKTKLFLICLLLSKFSFAQIEFGGSFFSNRLLNMDRNIDVLFSSGSAVYFSKYIPLGNRLKLQPSLQFQQTRIIMDAVFVKTTEATYFSQAPANNSQNTFSASSFKLPALISYNVEKDANTWLCVGPYVEYYLFTEQTYKVNYVKYKEKDLFENNFQMGLQAELLLHRNLKVKGPNVALHVGSHLQLTNYLNSSSFNPLGFYVKLGLMFK